LRSWQYSIISRYEFARQNTEDWQERFFIARNEEPLLLERATSTLWLVKAKHLHR
jgi:hypothetical protein